MLKKILELFEDVGIAIKEKDSLRHDVLTFLDKTTGSDEKTVKLPPKSVSKHCQEFIDSDRGRVWFEHGEVPSDWHHSKSRQEVAAALKDLTIKWLKARRDEMKKNETAYLPGRSKTTPKKKASAAPSKSPTTLASSSRFITVNRANQAGQDQTQTQADVLSDGETDPFSDTHFDDDSDNLTLPDIAEELQSRDKRSVDQNLTLAPAAVIRSLETAVTRTCDSLEVDTENEFRSVELQTPARTASRELLSPPNTTLKRRTDISNSEDLVAQDGMTHRENANPKRVRLGLEDMPPTLPASMLHPTQTIVGSHRVQSLDSEDTSRRSATTSSTRPHEQDISGSEPTPLFKTHLGFTRGYPQPASFRLESLLAVPATILDYIGLCERSSLAKANARGVSPVERKRFQDRSRVFHHLYTDIESRISNLASPEIKDEIEVDVIDLEGDASGNSVRVQVSSYCLWD